MKDTSQRRDRRQPHDLLAVLVLRAASGGEDIAGPANCFVRDLSAYGAGLVLTRIHCDGHHLFYSPDEEDTALFLESDDHEGAPISLPVRPIWFKLDDNDETRYFLMGVEFLADPDDERIVALKKAARACRGKGQGWFERMLARMVG